MRLRNIKRAKNIIENSKFVVKNKEELDKFLVHCDNLFVEIGMGKGDFIINNALKYKENFYIGIEKYESVALRAVEKLEKMENIPENLRIICLDAAFLMDYFDKNLIDGIYLNFSDPWTKHKHENRRLTSDNYLSLYRKLLKKGGFVEQKTDNKELFEYSVCKFKENYFNLGYVCYDLYADNKLLEDNIATEYEKKFHSLGNKINKLYATT